MSISFKESLPASVADKVNRVCDRFESAWKAGQIPSLNDHLDGTSGQERTVLLRELALIELSYRGRRGEKVSQQDYLHWFEGDIHRVQALFQAAGLPDSTVVDIDNTNTEWFVARNNQKLGPFTWHQLQTKAAGGEIAAKDMILQKGARKWVPANSVAGLFLVAAKTHAGGSAPKTVTGAASSAPAKESSTIAYIGPGNPTQGNPAWPIIAGYQILGDLGHGAMGIVYKAQHIELKRVVALKMVLSGGHARPEELARFRLEAEAVARLKHPNIVQIHDIGDNEGQPYFSLEFVDGGTLARKLAGNPQPPRQAAQLVETLARAMHVAHEHGIVHRDLKPSNVLLTPDGTLKIADFGLAKQLDADQGQTQTGAIMGTPSYMAPEQAAGKAKKVGPLSDVYALGVILYEMLTGRLPFKGESIADTLEQVRTQEPVPPTRLQPKVPRDLETICLKCLAKTPAGRYATAYALAEDLRRFEAGESVHARRTPWWERTAKWARRRPALASLAAVLMLVLLSATGFGWWTYWKEVGHTQALQEALNQKEAQRQLANSNALTAEKNAQLARQQEVAARRNLYAAHLNVAYKEWQRANVGAVRELLKRHIPRSGEEDLRSFEWRYLWGLCHQSLMTMESPRPLAASVAFSPDGLLLAVAAGNPFRDGFKDGHAADILLWDSLTGKLLDTLNGHTKDITGLAFTPDGGRLLSASLDATVRIWDVRTRKTAAILPDRVGPVRALALAPDGSYLVYGGRVETSLSRGDYQGKLCLWDLKEDKEIGCFPVDVQGSNGVNRLSFSPAGTLLAIGDGRGILSLWDPLKRRTTRQINAHLGIISGLAFSPDGRTLASASSPAFFSDDFEDLIQLEYAEDGRLVSRSTRGGDLSQLSKQKFRKEGEVKLWHVDGPDQMALQTALAPVSGRITSLTFSSDGRTLAAGDSDHTVTLWDPSTGLEKTTLRGHSRDVMGLAYSPGGGILVSVGADNVMEFWDPAKSTEAVLPAVWKNKVDSLSFSGDGAVLATGESGGGGVRLWDVATRSHLAALVKDPSIDFQVAFSPKENLLAIGTRKLVKPRPPGEVTLWDVNARKQIAFLGTHQGGVAVMAFTPDGQHLIGTDELGWAKVWSRHSHKELAHVQISQLWLNFLAVASDGKSLAVRETGNHLTLWSIPDLHRLGTLDDSRSFAFAPDGKTAASFSPQGQLTLWDWPERKKRISLPGMARNSSPRLHFSPDGTSLISNLLPVRFMDASTAEERFTVEDPDNNFRNLIFSPDGNVIAAGTKKVMLWHAAPLSLAPRDLKSHLLKLKPLDPALAQEACRLQFVRWLQDNVFPDPDVPMASDFEKAHAKGLDFELILGPDLTRTGKPYVLKTYKRQFFVFELSLKQVEALGVRKRGASARNFPSEKETPRLALVRLEFPRIGWKDAEGTPTLEGQISLATPVRPQVPLVLRRLLVFPDGSSSRALLTLKDFQEKSRPVSFTSKVNLKVKEASARGVPLFVFLDVCEERHEAGNPNPTLVPVSNIVATLVEGVPAGRPLEPTPVLELTVGKFEKGNLTPNDRAKTHTVALFAGKSYLIDLTGDFDTLLRIEDSQGKLLLENDDVSPPENLNSRLVFTPQRNDIYKIIATSFKGASTGAFSLQVQEATAVGEAMVFMEKLSNTDTKNQGKYFKTHKIQLMGGSPYTIELASQDFDTFLLLRDPVTQKVIAENDDIAPGNTTLSRIDFTPKADQSFDILVSSFGPGETGAYTLRVQRYQVKPK